MLLGKRVVICTDSGIEAMRLRHIFLQAGLYVIGSAATGRDAVDVTLESKPDIVLMSRHLHDMDGLEAARRLLAQGRVCIVMIADDYEEGIEPVAWQIGLSDCLVQPVTRERLLSRLEMAWNMFETENKKQDRAEAASVERAA